MSSDAAAEAAGRAVELAEERFLAATGPGGQNVNKVASAVQLRLDTYSLGLPHPVFHRLKVLAGSRMNSRGEIVLNARNSRTQDANREDARKRLAELIEKAFEEPKTRAKSRVNRLGKAKRLQAKKERGQVKANRGKVDW
jgi:ribosome-associated protein